MTLHTIKTNGARLLVSETGSGAPTLIFLHYWGGSARTWDKVVALLPATTHSIAVNQRGWSGSVATNGHYDLDSAADDVLSVVEARGIDRFIIVGHSMGGKIAQIIAARHPIGLEGLVLVAPSPPTPMKVPEEVRAGMLASYQSRDGVQQALGILTNAPLSEELREQVIADTLSGDADAKTYWTTQGMTRNISAEVGGLTLPIMVVLGENDQIEREPILRPELLRFYPHMTFTMVPQAGHLLPLEAPEAVASAAKQMLAAISV